MLETDYKYVRHLVREYSTLEVLEELQIALRDEANNFSDMGLKEKALILLEDADILENLRNSFNE